MTQAEGKPFLTLLYPRRPADAKPSFSTIAGGNGVKITTMSPGSESPATTAYAFLAPGPVEFTDRDVSFHASAGYIRTGEDETIIALPAGGNASAKGLSLQAQDTASLTASADKVTIHANGKAQTIVLSGKLPQPSKVTLDGDNVTLAASDGTVTVAVSAGMHRLEISK